MIAAGGNLTLIAGQDVNARAADVTAGKQLAVGAGRDINLTAGVETGSAYDETHYKTSGFMSSKTTHTITSSDWATAKGSNFTGDTVALMAGRDLTVQGSNVIGDNDVLLMANRDITIAAAAESYKDYQYEKVTRSGLGGGSSFNIGYSKQARTDWMKGESGGYSSSTLGSIGGNVTIDAGRDVGVFLHSGAERRKPMERLGWPVQELSPMVQYCVTARCAAGLQRDMTPADLLDKRYQNADILAYMGQTAGRFGAATGTLATATAETGNSKAGLQHIVEEHGSQFAQMGVSEAQIPGVVMGAVSEGKLVGDQGSGVGRPIYELNINGQTQRIAVAVGDKGFVVGGNPRGSGK